MRSIRELFTKKVYKLNAKRLHDVLLGINIKVIVSAYGSDRISFHPSKSFISTIKETFKRVLFRKK